MKSALFCAIFLALAFSSACCNFRQFFLGGQIYYIDGDCYARMTRVRMVLEKPGRIIRHHDFENFPSGIASHTTAPLDYLIAALSGITRIFTANNVDWAGALVSPLLALLTMAFVCFWSKKAVLPFRGALLFLFAVSPIIGHGFLFGRPNHHALQMLLMTVALGAEWMLWKENSRNWNVVSGVAFGLGIWVSLYEPLVLLLLVLVVRLVFFRRLLFSREAAAGLGVFLFIGVLFLLVEGITVKMPDEILIRYFKPWVATVGEMQSATPFSPLLYGWVGILLLAAPVLFAVASWRGQKIALPAFVILAALYALTLWQIRWGYFFAIYFAMTLPVQLGVFRRRWLAWTLFVLCMWPVASAWDARLFPSRDAQDQTTKQELNSVLLRDAAEHLKGGGISPIMAPWWVCPALSYWSGQPAVAGTSHESLPGIVDSARFFLTTDAGEARAILKARRIRWVVCYEAQTVTENSSKILGLPVPEKSLGEILYSEPGHAPGFLRLTYQNAHYPYYKIYRVDVDRL